MAGAVVTQKITSAATSVKQVPAILNKIVKTMRMPEAFFAGIRDVLDMGGGKYDLLTKEFKDMGIRNWVYDPFNRTPEHNAFVVEKLTTRGADIAICSNVLNVIQDDIDRKHMIRLLQCMTNERDHMVFFTVYEGDRTSKGKKTTKGWQANRPTEDYVDYLSEFFHSVSLSKHKLLVCEGFKP